MIRTATNPTRLAGATALAALLASCGPTPYEPAGPAGSTGYETTQLAPDRYLVSFEGNATTSRRTVETYMLYRAAEVASRAGYPYFAIVEQDTERDVDVDVYRSSPGFYGYGAGFGVGTGFGFPYYSSYGYGASPTVSTTDSYEAFATVQLLRDRSAGREDVLATQDVLSALGPRIERSDT